MKIKEKQDEVRVEAKVVVIKVDATCPDMILCSLYDTNTVYIISTVSDNVNWTPTNNKVYSKIEKKTVDMTFHRLNDIHK